MQLKDIMTRNFQSLHPHDTLYRGAKILRRYRLNAVPVTLENGALAGIFTRSNLLDALTAGNTLTDTITGIYNRDVLSVVNENLPYSQVVHNTKISPVSTGVVVDDDNKVVGLFTKQDMLVALFQQEEKYNAELKAVYRAIPHGLITVDSGGIIDTFNPAAEKMLGLENNNAAGRHLDNLIPCDYLQDVLEKGTIITGHKHTFNNTVTLLNCVPVIRESGITGAIIIFQDITEIENTAYELESIKRLYQILEIMLDTAYGGIITIDEEGKILFVNNAYIDFFSDSMQQIHPGQSPEEQKSTIEGRHIEKIFPDSPLLKVLKTGTPEINSIENYHNTPYVVSRIPIIKDEKILGAVSKIVFQNAHQLQDLASRVEQLNNQLKYYREELEKAHHKQCNYEFNNIIGISNTINKLKNDSLTVARGHSNVLICGESGTGKELFAQAIHMASPRKNEPFIKVNCSAIPENLLESELFGYASGAFTGASKTGKQGRFEMADKGTIFLDEIGDMPYAMQSKLLQVLQEQRFERVGGTSTVQVDVRVISATNQDLEEKIQKGQFRADLYYRLKVIQLKIPPLRERRDDIPPLIYAFLEKFNRDMHTGVTNISYEALQVLQGYNWPGNIRELENTIESALNFAGTGTLKKEHLPAEIADKAEVQNILPGEDKKHPSAENQEDKKSLNFPGDLPAPSKDNYRSTKQYAEKEAILHAINETQGNKSKAAQKLGISRSWLYEKMKRLGIN